MEKRNLVILHGWQSSKESWAKVKELLEKQGVDVFIPDLPGFKQETKLENPWDLDDYLRWFEKLCENKKPFYLMGHSFGGRISLKFAAKHSERLKGLILCDSAGIKPKHGVKIKGVIFLSKLAEMTPEFIKENLKKIYYFFARRTDYVKASPVMRKTMKKVLAEDLLLLTPLIKANTLIIWGEDDKVVPLQYARVFKQNIQNSELKILPEIKHSPHIKDPKMLAETVLEFLKKDI